MPGGLLSQGGRHQQRASGFRYWFGRCDGDLRSALAAPDDFAGGQGVARIRGGELINAFRPAARDRAVRGCRRRTATWSRSSRPFATWLRTAKTPVTGVLQDFIRM